jgi:hypothetical protein
MSEPNKDQKVWSRELGVGAWARALLECDGVDNQT